MTRTARFTAAQLATLTAAPVAAHELTLLKRAYRNANLTDDLGYAVSLILEGADRDLASKLEARGLMTGTGLTQLGELVATRRHTVMMDSNSDIKVFVTDVQGTHWTDRNPLIIQVGDTLTLLDREECKEDSFDLAIHEYIMAGDNMAERASEFIDWF